MGTAAKTLLTIEQFDALPEVEGLCVGDTLEDPQLLPGFSIRVGDLFSV